MDDNSYVLLQKLRDQHMTEFGREFNLDTTDGVRAIDGFIDSIRAEARAEALKEAADRAVLFYRFQLLAPAQGAFLTEDSLRAAILADEPKERESEGLVDWDDLKKIAEEQFDLRAKNARDCKSHAMESGDTGELECYSCELQILSRGFDSWLMAYHIMRSAEVERKLKEAER